MFREENRFGYHDRTVAVRPPKRSTKIKTLAAKRKSEEQTSRIRKAHGWPDRKLPQQEEHRREYDASQNRPAAFRRSVRKISREKLELLILKHIVETDARYLSVEDTARLFRVKDKFVQQVFAGLNRKGILSQAAHHPLHDSNRDPWGIGGYSGWASDRYCVRNIRKAAGIVGITIPSDPDDEEEGNI